MANPGYSRRVVARQSEARLYSLGALDKQAHRLELGQFTGWWKARRIGNAKRQHLVVALAVQAQDLAARHQYFQFRAGSKQVGNQRRRARHLLEVVQHEQ